MNSFLQWTSTVIFTIHDCLPHVRRITGVFGSWFGSVHSDIPDRHVYISCEGVAL